MSAASVPFQPNSRLLVSTTGSHDSKSLISDIQSSTQPFFRKGCTQSDDKRRRKRTKRLLKSKYVDLSRRSGILKPREITELCSKPMTTETTMIGSPKLFVRSVPERRLRIERLSPVRVTARCHELKNQTVEWRFSKLSFVSFFERLYVNHRINKIESSFCYLVRRSRLEIQQSCEWICICCKLAFLCGFSRLRSVGCSRIAHK